ncbi:MAG: hypothetical protein IK093_04410 [Ruminiclostridium sp.]|nr:hypothetical protein [Ruminiclostridium sp.]
MAVTRDRLKFIDRDMMKYIAVFFMFWGHLVAWVTMYRNPGTADPYSIMPFWMKLVSHASLLCPPIMFFFIADGYKYTRDRKKYALRLLIFALVTQPFDWLIFVPISGWWTSNVLFVLFFGLLAIIAWESGLKRWQRVLLVILCSGATLLISAAWEIFGVLLILFIHIYRERPKARLIAYTATALVWKGLAVMWQVIGGTLSAGVLLDDGLDLAFVMLGYVCMTVFYNGKKGKHPLFAKWFFYTFFPVHYVIIWVVAEFMR